MGDPKKFFCPRLIDYVVVVGARQPGRGSHAVQPPELLRKYPPRDHADFALSPDVVFFCQPEGCVAVGPRRVTLRESNCFVFALTEKDTSRVRYGICVNFYRPIEKRASTKDKSRKKKHPDQSGSKPPPDDSEGESRPPPPAAPRHLIKSHSLTSLCIISHHPFFSTFRECLVILRKLIDACNEKNLSRRVGSGRQNRETVWSYLTGRLSDSAPPSIIHGIRELEMWILGR